MTDINKQKFLNELSRLLTFMYEEDRELALNMYNDAFDCAEDPQLLISRLVSPTRQAVVIARAYDAKERKLQIYSEPGESDYGDEIPAFVQAIQNVLPEVVVYEDDAYYEADCEPEAEEEAEPEEAELYEEAEAEAPEEAELSEDSTLPEAPEIPVPEIKDADELSIPEAPVIAEAEVSEAPEIASADAGAEKEADEAEEAEQSEEAEAAEEAEDGSEAPEAPEAEDVPEDEAGEKDDFVIDTDNSPSVSYNPLEDNQESLPETVIKANIPLLILFVILAVPLSLAGIILLLVPTVLCLALACAAIYSGSAILVATFSGFAVFADIMVMLGLALIVLALGLLFLWLFIWFIGGAMAGLLRGVISLCRKCCYKEVQSL